MKQNSRISEVEQKYFREIFLIGALPRDEKDVKIPIEKKRINEEGLAQVFAQVDYHPNQQ